MTRRTAILATVIAMLPLACMDEPKRMPTDRAGTKATQDEKPEANPKPKDPFEEHLALLKEVSQRTNGVLLTATAEIKDDSIEIKWTLDYDGPRPPLIIQKPMYPGNARAATSIRIVARGVKPRVLSVQFVARRGGPGFPPPLTKDDYTTVEKGKTATGKTSLPVADVKARFIKDFPEHSGETPPKEVFVQLLHLPTERGEQFDYDAWTGGLYSLPVRLSMAKR